MELIRSQDINVIFSVADPVQPTYEQLVSFTNGRATVARLNTAGSGAEILNTIGDEYRVCMGALNSVWVCGVCVCMGALNSVCVVCVCAWALLTVWVCGCAWALLTVCVVCGCAWALLSYATVCVCVLHLVTYMYIQ